MANPAARAQEWLGSAAAASRRWLMAMRVLVVPGPRLEPGTLGLRGRLAAVPPTAVAISNRQAGLYSRFAGVRSRCCQNWY